MDEQRDREEQDDLDESDRLEDPAYIYVVTSAASEGSSSGSVGFRGFDASAQERQYAAQAAAQAAAWAWSSAQAQASADLVAVAVAVTNLDTRVQHVHIVIKVMSWLLLANMLMTLSCLAP